MNDDVAIFNKISFVHDGNIFDRRFYKVICRSVKQEVTKKN